MSLPHLQPLANLFVYLRFTIKSKQNALPSTLCPCCGSYLPQSRFCSCPQIFALHHRQGSHQTLEKHWNEYLLIVLFFFTWIKTLAFDDCLHDSLFFLSTHISSSCRRKGHGKPHINVMSCDKIVAVAPRRTKLQFFI